MTRETWSTRSEISVGISDSGIKGDQSEVGAKQAVRR
jgi:hypothetical protein